MQAIIARARIVGTLVSTVRVLWPGHAILWMRLIARKIGARTLEHRAPKVSWLALFRRLAIHRDEPNDCSSPSASLPGHHVEHLDMQIVQRQLALPATHWASPSRVVGREEGIVIAPPESLSVMSACRPTGLSHLSR